MGVPLKRPARCLCKNTEVGILHEDFYVQDVECHSVRPTRLFPCGRSRRCFSAPLNLDSVWILDSL